MYEGKIVAEIAVALPADVRAALPPQRDRDTPGGSALLGFVILLVGLPLLATRVFAHLVARDLRKLGTLARILGAAAADARR